MYQVAEKNASLTRLTVLEDMILVLLQVTGEPRTLLKTSLSASTHQRVLVTTKEITMTILAHVLRGTAVLCDRTESQDTPDKENTNVLNDQIHCTTSSDSFY